MLNYTKFKGLLQSSCMSWAYLGHLIVEQDLKIFDLMKNLDGNPILYCFMAVFVSFASSDNCP